MSDTLGETVGKCGHRGPLAQLIAKDVLVGGYREGRGSGQFKRACVS
ncbi:MULTISPECIES: hypothetical protein [Thalassococcus]|nr:MULTISPECIES: hypothetical protein [Thalassococcus]MBO6868174.1 hypothetical protein [Thalassococcus sp.]